MTEPFSSDKTRRLTWTDCAGLIVGIILGTGIFTVFPTLAAAHAPSVMLLACAWLGGTLVALFGALCFAELSSLFPNDGGEYVFLRQAFSRGDKSPVSFLFAWAQILVIRPASLVSLAIVLGINARVVADHATGLLGGAALSADSAGHFQTFLACGSLVFFTAVALLGVRISRPVQNVFTLVKLLCLAVLIGVGLYTGRHSLDNLSPLWLPEGFGAFDALKSVGMALIPVMWVLGGWNEAPYVAGEMRNPSRDIPRALLVGLLGLGILYTLINMVYVLHLTPAGLAGTWTFASDLMKTWFGPTGELVMALILVVSTAGAINGLVLTGGRMTEAFAEDMGLWKADNGGLSSSLLVNLGLALALALILDCRPEGIDNLLVFTAGVVWIFFALVAGCVFVFRRRFSREKLPYRVPFYPFTPLAFLAMCAFMLWGAWEYKPRETLLGVAVLAAGVPAYYLSARLFLRFRGFHALPRKS